MSIPQRAVGSHPVLPDIRPRMARAHVQKPDIDWMEAIGRAIALAVAMTGWSNKEAAARVHVDDAEFGKWLSGARRPQFDRLFSVPELRDALIETLAALSPAYEIAREIRRVRKAAGE